MSVRRNNVLYRDFSSVPARKDGPFLVIFRQCKLNKSMRFAYEHLRSSLRPLQHLNSTGSWNIFLPTLTYSMQLRFQRYVDFSTVAKSSQ